MSGVGDGGDEAEALGVEVVFFLAVVGAEAVGGEVGADAVGFGDPAAAGEGVGELLLPLALGAPAGVGGSAAKTAVMANTATARDRSDGVILGADTRATEGPIAADKNCEKIHYMAPNIYCCGAGTAADTEAVTGMSFLTSVCVASLPDWRDSRVITALTLLKKHLFSYQGHVSAALVLGGVDITGPHLHTIYPHGSTDTLPFATMGSGSLAAMSVFEAKYKEGLTRDEGIKLVAEAICSGIFNDLGSGSNVDICVITKGNKEYLRNYMEPNPRTYVSSKGYSFTKKTEVLRTKITPLMERVEITEVGEAMEE
ncbi:hypothetical protein Bca52824_030158 [Brassica carinata]|uniref:proteasome endopeptidase complex n=1 Tax=Brassica carinata TaxID=52824 RepID=A0A8X7S857_BRACI|nr:hypothetical protein Bca52824_030158 [Brassica carinata]